jgi:hypothetical protein
MTVKRDKELLITTSSQQCVLRAFVYAGGKVSCVVDSLVEQDLKFYIPRNDPPVSVSVPAGKSTV